MTSWPDYGLPPFQTSGYRYSINAGLIRTPFETAQPRQRRAFATNPHKFSASVWVNQTQLTVAEWFLKSFGYTWFVVNLTDNVGTDVPHFVRCTADYRVSVKGFNTYEIQLELETYAEVQEIPAYVTSSSVYPQYVIDAIVGAPPIAAKSVMEMYDTDGAFDSSPLVGYPPATPASVTEVFDTEGAGTSEAARGGAPDVPTVTLTHI